mmetsp:Transcript_17082/g.40769  ORF Transcript_17082/g.40769 Transcript_17082/m.40769 type:complete len:302 (-) Transcript_17082:241-1146(-)
MVWLRLRVSRGTPVSPTLQTRSPRQTCCRGCSQRPQGWRLNSSSLTATMWLRLLVGMTRRLRSQKPSSRQRGQHQGRSRVTSSPVWCSSCRATQTLHQSDCLGTGRSQFSTSARRCRSRGLEARAAARGSLCASVMWLLRAGLLMVLNMAPLPHLCSTWQCHPPSWSTCWLVTVGARRRDGLLLQRIALTVCCGRDPASPLVFGKRQWQRHLSRCCVCCTHGLVSCSQTSHSGSLPHTTKRWRGGSGPVIARAITASSKPSMTMTWQGSLRSFVVGNNATCAGTFTAIATSVVRPLSVLSG